MNRYILVTAAGMLLAWTVGAQSAAAPDKTVGGSLGEVKKLQGDVQLQAARIALASLRASVEGDLSKVPTRVAVAPGDSAVSPEEAAALLARMPKPLQCTARVDASVLRVSCGVIDASWRAVYGYGLDDLDSEQGVIGSIEHEALLNENGRVLVVGNDEAFLVSLQTVKAWFRNYLVTLRLSIGSGPPEEAERRRGAEYVVTLSRHDDVDPSSEWGQRLLELRRPMQPDSYGRQRRGPPR